MSRHPSNMTPQKLLELYVDYINTQKDVATFMLWAMDNFQGNDDEYCWRSLFLCEEAKDKRAVIWRKLQDHYPRALCIKEGVMI